MKAIFFSALRFAQWLFIIAIVSFITTRALYETVIRDEIRGVSDVIRDEIRDVSDAAASYTDESIQPFARRVYPEGTIRYKIPANLIAWPDQYSVSEEDRIPSHMFDIPQPTTELKIVKILPVDDQEELVVIQRGKAFMAVRVPKE